ncbi:MULTISPECIES: hypothetical protein [unclassified Bradyrhizobium]|uniref:hypothetical protein n=1 Tax=unclassified Bradyrhizobium TaxID=2631580 RepID=UPI002FF0593C
MSANATASTAEICQLTGFTKQYLHALEQDGIVSRIGRDQWPLAPTIRSVITHLRSENRRGQRGVADARLADMKTQALAVRLQRETNDLVPYSQVQEALDLILGTLVTGLMSVPARCTRDVGLRRIIETEIDAARLAACAEYRRHADSLRKTGKAAGLS